MDQVQIKALLSRYFFNTFLIYLCVYVNCLKGYPLQQKGLSLCYVLYLINELKLYMLQSNICNELDFGQYHVCLLFH